jgi:hypothetical protein
MLQRYILVSGNYKLIFHFFQASSKKEKEEIEKLEIVEVT